MTYDPSIINLTVSYSPDHEAYLVHEVSNAFSFAMIPTVRVTEDGVKASVCVEFDTKEQAVEQVRRLTKWQKNGGKLELRSTETPERFEAVADTKYGCAWE